MIIRKHLLITIISSLLLFNCGFKIVKKDGFQDFGIYKIDASGENRINYILKNKLKNIGKKSENNFHLDIKSNKLKIIKEKNIKNEITKYELQIKINIKHYKPLTGTVNTFSLIESQSYTVDKQHSQTLNNEKKVINLLTDKLFDQIILKLLETNDL